MTADALAGVLGRTVGVVARRQTWRNVAYLALTVPLTAAYSVLLGAGVGIGAALALFGVGLLLLLGCAVAALVLADLERGLATRLLRVGIPAAPAATGARGLAPDGLRARLARTSTWRSLAYLAIQVPFAIALGVAGTAAAVVIAVLLLEPARVLHRFPSWLPSAGGLGASAIAAGLGAGLLLAALHAANGVAALWGKVAVAMLGPTPEERQLWEARRQAERAETARRELIVNVSHDLRTPVASIQAHVDTLLMPPDRRPGGVDQDLYLTRVADESRRLAALIDDLLMLARADASELRLAVNPVELAPVIRQVAGALEPLARQGRRVTLAHAEVAPDLRAFADPERLAQVLTNLVRNGVNHTPEGGAVYLEAGADSTTAWVTVSDTGTGIPPADLPRVFDRFYRGDQSRSRDSGGFGLGLSIARELVEAMGGSLTVSSQPAAGSCFRVALRRVR